MSTKRPDSLTLGLSSACASQIEIVEVWRNTCAHNCLLYSPEVSGAMEEPNMTLQIDWSLPENCLPQLLHETCNRLNKNGSTLYCLYSITGRNMTKAMTSPRTVVVMPPTKSRNSVFASLGGWVQDGTTT